MIAKEQLKEIGVFEYQILSPKEITFEERLRKFCEQNACRLYGKTWACPPAVGTVAQCKKRCLSYQNALVFNAVYPLEDSFDYEGMMEGHDAFQALCDRLYALIPKGTPFLLLSICSISDSFTVHTRPEIGKSFWLITSIIPSACGKKYFSNS